MKKLFVGILVGLGLVVTGVMNANEVSACESCNTDSFAEQVIEEHIHEDLCTEIHGACEECGGYFCENLTCWCGEEANEADDYYEYFENVEHKQCAECNGVYSVVIGNEEGACETSCYCGKEVEANEMSEEKAVEVNVVMNYEEYYVFEEMVFDMYLEACVNACDECGYYYYEECMCESECNEREECDECFYYDYELFIADNYEMIIDLAEDIVIDIQETIEEMNQASVMYYEF